MPQPGVINEVGLYGKHFAPDKSWGADHSLRGNFGGVKDFEGLLC
jgi:hypothetical protein